MDKKDKLRIMNHIRLAFRRSEVFKSAFVVCRDAAGPRGGKRFICSDCPSIFKQSEIQIDHIVPIVPWHMKKLEMNIGHYSDKVFCSPDNLQPLCKPCHLIKSNSEKNKRVTGL